MGWIRYRGDALLVDATGTVAEAVYGLFDK
jgi:hypothetical protein